MLQDRDNWGSCECQWGWINAEYCLAGEPTSKRHESALRERWLISQEAKFGTISHLFLGVMRSYGDISAMHIDLELLEGLDGDSSITSHFLCLRAGMAAYGPCNPSFHWSLTHSEIRRGTRRLAVGVIITGSNQHCRRESWISVVVLITGSLCQSFSWALALGTHQEHCQHPSVPHCDRDSDQHEQRDRVFVKHNSR